jgi:hypothetical protein
MSCDVHFSMLKTAQDKLLECDLSPRQGKTEEGHLLGPLQTITYK